MILTLAISGYRSIRDMVLPLQQLNVVTGANGSGKSSFYRALRLLAEVAQGRAVASLASEGGLQSTLWAGPEVVTRAMRAGEAPVEGTKRKARVALKLGFASDDYGYAVDLGLPVKNRTLFNLDPEIKAEAVWAGEVLSRRNMFASRNGPVVQALDDTGRRQIVTSDLAHYDSMMTHVADPRALSELLVLRERMRGWRFYDHFRTDADAPARRSQVGTRTPVLAGDGADLAAAIQTIAEIGDWGGFLSAVEDAFPGSSVEVTEAEGRFGIVMHQHGLLRPLSAAELSDGTLRYLLLVAALLTPRPPELLVLNEPETSLHPDLLPPLARLIAVAAESSQVIVVTHASALVQALSENGNCASFELQKDTGETVVRRVERSAWNWPAR